MSSLQTSTNRKQKHVHKLKTKFQIFKRLRILIYLFILKIQLLQFSTVWTEPTFRANLHFGEPPSRGLLYGVVIEAGASAISGNPLTVSECLVWQMLLASALYYSPSRACSMGFWRVYMAGLRMWAALAPDAFRCGIIDIVVF